jgi:hypothetical protein
VIHRFDDGFIVRAVLATRVYSEEKQQTPESAPVRISVAFALTYLLDNAMTASDEVLAEFARVNGAFNAWPYFREFVQAMSVRMSLPPIVLPVLRVKSSTSTPAHPRVEPAEATTKTTT